jgi:putative component of membrane protein insertase Oxa1/YidC/SpoIIIJ protein YidD
MICYAQQRDMLSEINQTLSQQIRQKEIKAESEYRLESGNNIPSSLLKSSFFFYKNFISPQDYSNCTFIPSCSEYSKIALEEMGLVRGYLMTFDRLCRCHGFSPRKYTFDQESGRLIDKVR